MEINLEGIQKTLLIPLWSRAKLSKENNPVIIDLKAIDIIEKSGYDFNRIDKNIPYFAKLMLAVRANEIDKITKSFIIAHPEALIINLGAGLDTAFYRVDNGSIRWIDIDLPDVIKLRKILIPETNRSQTISSSIFDMEWVREVSHNKNGTLLISGGVLPYFKEKIIRKFFIKIMDCFPECEMVFDVQSRTGNIISNLGMIFSGSHSAAMHWGINNASEMEIWDKRIRIIEKYPLFSRTKRYPDWDRRVIKIIDLSDKFNMTSIVHIKKLILS